MSNAFADLLWDDSLAEEELDAAIEARNSIALAVHPAGADAGGVHAHRHENSAAAAVAAPVVKSLMASFRRQLTAQSAAIVASAEANANAAAAGMGASANQAADAATEASLAAMSPMQRAFAESPALMRILMHHRTLQQQNIVADQLRRRVPLQPSIESIKRSKAAAEAAEAAAMAAAAAEAKVNNASAKAVAPVSAFSLKRQRTLQGSSGAVATYLADSLGGGSISARGEHSVLRGVDRLPSIKRSVTNSAAATTTAIVPTRPASLQAAAGLSRNFLKELLRNRADNFTQQFERTRSNSLQSAAAASAASAAAALNDITEEPVAPHVETASSDEYSAAATARSNVVVDLRALSRPTLNPNSDSHSNSNAAAASSLTLQIDDATLHRGSAQLVLSPVAAGDSPLLSGAAASLSPAPAHTPLATAPQSQSQSTSSMTPRIASTSSSSVHLSFESSTTTNTNTNNSTSLSSLSSLPPLPPLPPLSPVALALAAGPVTSADSSATKRHAAAAAAPSHNSASYPVFRTSSQQMQEQEQQPQGDDAIDSAWAATLKQSMVERGEARRRMSVGAPLPQHIKPIERLRKVSRRVLQSVRISRVFERQMQSLSHFLNRRTMTFTDEGIEDGFALAHISNSGNRILLLLFINIFTTILFVVQDYFTSPLNFLSTLVPIRFFVIVPALAVAALTVQLLSHRPFYMQVCFFMLSLAQIFAECDVVKLMLGHEWTTFASPRVFCSNMISSSPF